MKTPMLKTLSNKVAVFQAFNVIKKRLKHKCFLSVAKFSRTAFL